MMTEMATGQRERRQMGDLNTTISMMMGGNDGDNEWIQRMAQRWEMKMKAMLMTETTTGDANGDDKDEGDGYRR